MQVLISHEGVFKSIHFKGKETAKSRPLPKLTNFEKIKISDVLKVHKYGYINKMIKFVSDIKGADVVKYDRDTYVNKDTWKTALIAAGSVTTAVDKVMRKEI